DQTLPVMQLIISCHGAFSEESGELALGKLTQDVPSHDASDLSRCQAIWKLLLLYSRHVTKSLESNMAKARVLGTLLCLFHCCLVDTPDYKAAIKEISTHFSNVILQICSSGSSRSSIRSSS